MRYLQAEEEDKWVKHYASYHQILLVGEGNFSFALSLARSFGTGSNIVATSLDSYDTVIKKYNQAKANIEKLERLGAFVLNKVDATKMKHHRDLRNRRFDRIIYNFPHAGFYRKEDDSDMIKMHQKLVNDFFYNAAGMLRADGEVHVTHKTSYPYTLWDLQGLALRNSLIQIGCVDFKISDYPGYNNKRGADYPGGYKNRRGVGLTCDDPFRLGQASTFMFVCRPAAAAEELRRQKRHLVAERWPPSVKQQQQQQQQPVMVPFTELPIHHDLPRHTQTGYGGFSPQIRSNHSPPSVQFQHASPVVPPVHPNSIHHPNLLGSGSLSTPRGLPPLSPPPQPLQVFDWYFEDVEKAFGMPDPNIAYNVQRGVRYGYERYVSLYGAENSSGFLDALIALYRLSVEREAWLEAVYQATLRLQGQGEWNGNSV